MPANTAFKPIIGCEVYLTAGSRFDKGTRKDNPIYHLILLAKNETGYRNLMKLCSIGHLEGFHYKPRIDLRIACRACGRADLPELLSWQARSRSICCMTGRRKRASCGTAVPGHFRR